MRKSGFNSNNVTPVQALIIVILIGLVVYGVVATNGCEGAFEGIESGYGKHLVLVSHEPGFINKNHWQDLDSGKCYWTDADEDASIVYEEPCRDSGR